MKAVVKKHGQKEWLITPLEGQFSGQAVMTAEGLTLDRVTFEDGCIYGNVTGVWGAVIPDELTLDRTTLRGLGIGQLFSPRAKATFIYEDGNFVDLYTGQILVRATHAMLFGSGMFYNPKKMRGPREI